MNAASVCTDPDELLTTTSDIAKDINAKRPSAVQDAYRSEQQQTTALASNAETQEAIAAFREKRGPEYE